MSGPARPAARWDHVSAGMVDPFAGGGRLTGAAPGYLSAVTDTRNYADSFAILDADGDGRVSASELVGLMRSLGDDVTDEAAAHAVELMDTDGDGQVSLEEFAGYLEHRSAGPGTGR